MTYNEQSFWYCCPQTIPQNGCPTMKKQTCVALLLGLALMLLLYLALPSLSAQTIRIDWTTTLQPIDGFGASSGGLAPTLTSSQMDFFYTTSGIGLDFIRLKIFPTQKDCEDDEAGPGSCVVVPSGPTLSIWDLANAKAAVARGAKVLAAEWSPPAGMKTNHSFQGGGAMVGNAANYVGLASLQTSFIRLMTATYGIPIYAISVQNEPDVSVPYPSCTWSAQQFHDYIPYLASALLAAGYSDTKIMIAETGAWTNSYAVAAMSDPAVASSVGILASHAYGGSVSLLSYPNVTTQHQWETEVADFSPYDGTIRSALAYASEIHSWLMIAKVNGWNYWLVVAGQGVTDNEALTNLKGNVAKRAYAIGNWSKFVRPGWNMVRVENSGTLLVTAFENGPTGPTVFVVVNHGWRPIRQTFSVGTLMGQQATPWITSSSLSLAPQKPVDVRDGLITFTVPGRSIVTFQSGPPATQTN
jgi:glucuronoarabinoxylan endo-1,4-beta-xylanase